MKANKLHKLVSAAPSWEEQMDAYYAERKAKMQEIPAGGFTIRQHMERYKLSYAQSKVHINRAIAEGRAEKHRNGAVVYYTMKPVVTS